mmetsp:Transcript_14355/g.36681  ORF Transcript_14355/g.36681 Transcript_14355/m.36681 type:complete len:429 (-) Transcript_14355:78-1364(-)
MDITSRGSGSSHSSSSQASSRSDTATPPSSPSATSHRDLLSSLTSDLVSENARLRADLGSLVRHTHDLRDDIARALATHPRGSAATRDLAEEIEALAAESRAIGTAVGVDEFGAEMVPVEDYVEIQTVTSRERSLNPRYAFTGYSRPDSPVIRPERGRAPEEVAQEVRLQSEQLNFKKIVANAVHSNFHQLIYAPAALSGVAVVMFLLTLLILPWVAMDSEAGAEGLYTLTSYGLWAASFVDPAGESLTSVVSAYCTAKVCAVSDKGAPATCFEIPVPYVSTSCTTYNSIRIIHCISVALFLAASVIFVVDAFSRLHGGMGDRSRKESEPRYLTKAGFCVVLAAATLSVAGFASFISTLFYGSGASAVGHVDPGITPMVVSWVAGFAAAALALFALWHERQAVKEVYYGKAPKNRRFDFEMYELDETV